MVEVPTAEGYTVIVESIGAASPVVSKVLAEPLGLPVEVVLKALYSTPSVMFSNVDKETADTAEELLMRLGLETRVQSSTDPIPDTPNKVDVGVYLHDAGMLPTVCDELSEFIGCKPSEALGMLAAEPGVVLGGVSIATAEALSKRISAEVVISDPTKEHYTIEVQDKDEMLRHQLQAYFTHHKLPYNLRTSDYIEDLDYETTMAIWRKFQSTGLVRVINQSFQRYELILQSADTSNPKHKEVLINEVGMPEDIIDEVLLSLPIELETGLNRADLTAKYNTYQAAGLNCKARVLDTGKHYLIIESTSSLENARNILGQFYSTDQLPTTSSYWKSPEPLGDLLLRYATIQLENAGCELDYEAA